MHKIILPNNIAVIENDSHLTKWIKECGRLDHDGNIQTLVNMIPIGKAAIDVGASIGDHTIAYLRKAAKVYAFEPNPVAFDCLVHNCPKAVSYNVALGSEEDALYWISSAPNYGASFLTKNHQLYNSLKVNVKTLDMFYLDNIGFIKVDVEGWEVEFLKGAKDTIKRNKPILCLEVNSGALVRAGTSSDELISLIESYGYKTKPVTIFDPLQYDILGEPI